MSQNAFFLSSTVISSLFHFFGIVLLSRMARAESNQKLLIISLSGTELLYSLQMSVSTILKMLNSDKHVVFIIAYWILISTALAANKLMMLYLVMDRFADIYLHMRYPLIFTKTRVVKIVMALWMFSFVYSTVYSVLAIWENNFRNPLGAESNYVQNNNYLMLIIDTTITVIAATTYLYFYRKVSSIMKRDKSQEKQRNQGMNRSQHRKFLVPFLMVATYLVFNVTATGLFVVRRQSASLNRHTKDLLLDIGRNLTSVGYISDAVLYIFLQKGVRNSIKSFFRRICIRRPVRVSPRISRISDGYQMNSERSYLN